jgi:hypothetical protein
MKYIILKPLLLILFSLSLFANIDAQIEAIQKAPLQERFKLMNAFKNEIIQMQEEERIKALQKLKSITKSKHADKALKELTQRTKRHPLKQQTQRKEHSNSLLHTNNETETEESVENQTEESVENEAEDNIENETEENIENETEDNIEDEHDEDD